MTIAIRLSPKRGLTKIGQRIQCPSMKIAIIHSSAAGFFPRFYSALSTAIRRGGNECRLFVPNTRTNRLSSLKDIHVWGTRINTFAHQRLSALTGLQDVYSVLDTLLLIRDLRAYKPDIIHLQIINDKVLNLMILKQYIERYHLPVVWTMHDCRAITGRCAYFDEIGCERWIDGCGHCPQKELYEPTLIDASHVVWSYRKKMTNGISNLTIVTPSLWLSELLKKSYLSAKSIEVVHNGIDVESFNRHSQHPKILDVSGRKIVLGVAASWELRKGLNYFKRLAQDLPKDRYQVVLVGRLSQSIANVQVLSPTNSLEELAKIYQKASVFVNPTLADNFPTTNIEALACGVPIVTFQTGGSAECLADGCGLAVPKMDYQSLLDAVIEVCENENVYSEEKCKARAKYFSLEQYDIYNEIYNRITS